MEVYAMSQQFKLQNLKVIFLLLLVYNRKKKYLFPLF